MTLILGSTLKFSGVGVWFVGDLFVLCGSMSSHCLFSHLADCRFGRRMAKPKSETVNFEWYCFPFLFSDASELAFFFCLYAVFLAFYHS